MLDLIIGQQKYKGNMLVKKNIIDQENQEFESFSTKRATVFELEEILYEPIKVLDHGFIRVVDYMGNDNAIVQSARVSYGKGTKKLSQDQGLINYLMRHWHTTPFEMCELKLHVKLPMFVARQWIRHRTANVNEYSARYSILDKEFYIPKHQQLAAQSTENKQGRGQLIEGAEAENVLELLKRDAAQAYDTYEYLLNEGDNRDESRSSLSRELARMNLPVNYYTQWYWKIDLHNLMHFVRLRADHHAQYEIQAYAKILQDIMQRWVPMAYAAFLDYRQNSAQLSGKMVTVLKRMLKGEQVSQADSDLTTREWQEMQGIIHDS